MAKKEPDVVRSRVTAAFLARRSALYRHFLENYRAFEAAKDRAAGHFRWKDVAAALTEAGVRTSRGEPISALAAETTWRRVCKDVAARGTKRVRRPGRAKEPGPGIVREVAAPAFVPVARPSAPMPPLPANRPPEKKHTFRLARMRTDEESREYAAKERAEMMDRMKGNKPE
jgi:hypothetical protein